ncbi:MAG: ABC transporter permease [Acidobacteriota bacterium]|nr:ABC transporter permease [Acidobacteriota bacterium]
MPPALLIAAKDIRQRLRDRSAVMVGVVAPLVVALLMSMAFNGTSKFHYTLALSNADQGPVATAMVHALEAPGLRGIVTVRPYPTAAAAAVAVRDRKAQAGLVIPAGFSSAATGPRPVPLTTLTSVNDTISASVTASIVASFVAQLNADRLSVATATASGSTVPVASLSALASRLEIPVRTVSRPVGAHQLKVISYYAPSMSIFFVFFLVGYTTRSFFVDRDQGMIERMRAAPVRPVDIVAGKSLSVLVFGLASLLVIAAVTTAAFGADWGSPLAVVVVCAALVLSVVAVTALVMVAARTKRQAEGISSAVVFGLALLGGNFVFLSQSPAVMQRIALFTPNGWALRAFTDLSTTGGGLGTAAVPVLAILAFTAVVGLLIALLARQSVAW